VTVYESNPPQAEILQKGSVILKDLNNYSNAHLSSVAEHPHYYWYKDGVLQDLPGTQDDTTRNPIFKQGTCTDLPACTGNGVYTLVTAGADNCPSPPSEPKHIFFNNQAPLNIAAPATFTGNATSPSTASLQWTDSSPNELGFEVWRRSKLTATTYSKWVMAILTAPDASSFADAGLIPSTIYQYKIRAVGSAGRSNYTPSSSSQFLTITTHADVIAPTTPQNLTAASTGIREISLTWQGSTDDTGIKNYMIIYNGDTVYTPGAVTSLKLQNLVLNQDYAFNVYAVDLGGNYSQPSNTASETTVVNGLYYEHSTGSWSDLDLINWSIAEYKGKVNTVTLAPRTQEDYFNFEFDGYLYITIPGTYQVRTTSDDGSRFTLNNTVVVDNDGLHGNITVTSATLTLNSGPQLANIKYFEATGGQTLTVQYKGPDTGNNWITIPESAWKSGASSPPIDARMASTEETSMKETMMPKMEIYPNPVNANQTITVKISDTQEQPVTVRLVNLMGESIFERTIEADELSFEHQLSPTRPVGKGIYLLVLQQGDNVVKERVVVKE
jgi:hypothetical protein